MDENLRLKQIQKEIESKQSTKVPEGEDLLGRLFERKQHISYEKRKINDHKVELIKDHILNEEEKRKKMIENVTDKNKS